MKLKRKNRHIISYYWRGDCEDQKNWAFPTKEDAWAFVLGEIRKRIRAFKSEENVRGNGETDIDLDKVRHELFGNGISCPIYCQNSSWWDNWFYFLREG